MWIFKRIFHYWTDLESFFNTRLELFYNVLYDYSEEEEEKAAEAEEEEEAPPQARIIESEDEEEIPSTPQPSQ